MRYTNDLLTYLLTYSSSNSFVLFDAAEQDTRNLEDLEELVWDGNKAPPDQQIDQFMILARQVNCHTGIHVY